MKEVSNRLTFPLRDLWYTPSLFFPQVTHGDAPPFPHAWVLSCQLEFASSTQVPDLREILNLQIRQGYHEAVPIFFDFVPGKIIGWSNWVDEELSDGRGFANFLECSGIPKLVEISRNLEGFRDAKGLRHLVRR